MKNLHYIIFSFLFLSFPLSAHPFAGGSGTYDDPFLISTPEQLDSVRHYCGKQHADKHFLIINEIDLDVPPYNQGEGWIPIGGVKTTGELRRNIFHGKLYGYMDGKCGSGIIKNLKLGNIVMPNSNDISVMGLFGVLGEGALIKNIGLENYQINSKEHMIGVLVATTLSNTGNPIGRNVTIENCYTIGNTIGNINTMGGIIGASYNMSIKNCYTVCNIENLRDSSHYIGGIIASVSSEGLITNCYSKSNFISNGATTGIIAGMASGSVVESEISNCVAAGSIVTSNPGNRLLGFGFYAPLEVNLSNNYALNTTTINGNTITGGTTTNADGEDKTLAELQSQSFYENVLGWDFDSIWVMPEEKNGITEGFPVFQWQYKKELRVILENNFMEFDFGEIYVGATNEQSAEIKNLGGLAGTFVIPPFNNSDFVYLADNNTINPYGIYNYKVRFAPTESGEFSDTIKITTEPCNIEYTIVVKGKSIEKPPLPPIKYTIRASEHKQIDPRKKNHRIPIYITADADVANATIEKLVLEVDRNLFYPKRIENNNGTMSLNFIDTMIEMTLENLLVPALNADEEKVLLTIRGDVLLGNKDSNDIFVRAVKFSEELVEEPDLKNGYITIEICRAGGDRLVRWLDYVPAVLVKNNPVTSGILEVKCNAVERGNYSLEIIDLLGHTNTAIVDRWVVTATTTERLFDFVIPIPNYPNGSYLLVMNAPTRRYSTKFVIQK